MIHLIEVSIGSGNGFVLNSDKPLAELMLAQNIRVASLVLGKFNSLWPSDVI